MKNTFHFNTQIIGIIGHPIKHSYSPFIHNVAIEIRKLDYVYLPFDIPALNLKDALKGMTALGIKGFNITIPHKEAAIQYLSSVSDEVSIIGSVNTIVNEQGKLIGYNTDTFGILETLLPFKEEIAGNKVCVIGAGGSARAVIYTLIKNFKPKKIFIVNRNERRAENLKDFFAEKMKYSSIKTKELVPPSAFEVIKDSSLVVHTTPVGMHPNENDSVVTSADVFTKEQIVFDLVYNPQNTLLLKTASLAGAKTINGMQMLIAQAAKSFQLWTNVEFPQAEVLKSLQLYLNS
ncbi:MAG: shikimate dehydrogenase [Ignavibacteriaceae bacterium]|nr:shikimate dehydrogenase [Ignavibacteriaceae bacterium]